MFQVLDGLKVLDLTRLYPGPFCTQLLADYGAEVIKIESPGVGDYMRDLGGEANYFLYLNRGKKGMTLNLKTEKGNEIFKDLLKDVDVLVESFRPGVMRKMGLDYENLKKINARLVYCSITGYGQDGPYKDKAGHDINYLALSGIMDITGVKDGPPVIPGVQVADVGGGGLFALFGIMAALFSREKTGEGQYVDISMLDGLISWLPLIAAEHYGRNKKVSRGESILNGGLACYNVYKTKDNKYMSLGALESKFWQEFCMAVQKEDLLNKQYIEDQNYLKKELTDIFLGRTRNEWEKVFASKDACCEPVLEIGENFSFGQVRERGMIQNKDIKDKKHELLGYPIKFSSSEPKEGKIAPELGEHTESILLKLGYNRNEIMQLKESGVI